MSRFGGLERRDTIAAEATPPGRGGLSVVRVSGDRAGDVVSGMLDRPLPSPGRVEFARLKARSGGELLDEAVVAYFKAPRSYTGEDVVELSVHGSPVVVGELLAQLYESGVRPASPGEFTLRAYLNGRIDLTQAEAVADLVASRSAAAARSAVNQLSGRLSRAAEDASNYVVKLLMLCEVELDFVEDDVELASSAEKAELAKAAIAALEGMTEGYQRARRLREGARVVITGPPNVGKSSLFNALAGEGRAIVHQRPGTTRDVLRATVDICGVTFELFDTAGIRASDDEIEDEGVTRALAAVKSADLALDVSSPDVDARVEAADGVAMLSVINKIDVFPQSATLGGIPISAKTGEGIEALKRAIYRRVVGDEVLAEGSVSRERHYNAVMRAKSALQQALANLLGVEPVELTAEDLRDALGALDELTGKVRLDHILDEIFAGFCIGK